MKIFFNWGLQSNLCTTATLGTWKKRPFDRDVWLDWDLDWLLMTQTVSCYEVAIVHRWSGLAVLFSGNWQLALSFIRSGGLNQSRLRISRLSRPRISVWLRCPCWNCGDSQTYCQYQILTFAGIGGDQEHCQYGQISIYSGSRFIRSLCARMMTITMVERGSVDWISLDRKSLLSLDQKFHLH